MHIPVYIYIYLYTYIHAYEYIYKCICIYMHISSQDLECECICICTYIYTSMYYLGTLPELDCRFGDEVCEGIMGGNFFFLQIVIVRHLYSSWCVWGKGERGSERERKISVRVGQCVRVRVCVRLCVCVRVCVSTYWAAISFSRNTLNTPEHTATHCNTPQQNTRQSKSTHNTITHNHMRPWVCKRMQNTHTHTHTRVQTRTRTQANTRKRIKITYTGMYIHMRIYIHLRVSIYVSHRTCGAAFVLFLSHTHTPI